MPDLTVVYRRLDELEPDPVNPKDHDLGAVHASIGRFGYIEPIVVDERTGRIVSGHGRTQALAQLAGLDQDPPEGIRRDDDGTWMVPVVTGWASRSDDDAKAALIALNRTVELGGWDTSALTELLAMLAETEEGLAGTGYDVEDLDGLIADLEREAEDPEPSEPDEKPWPHRAAADCTVTVLHGDCVEHMEGLLANSIDALVSDPPYGIEFMGRAWDRYTAPEFAAWCQKWGEAALRVVKPGGHLIAFGATRTHHRLMQGLEDAGWEIRDCGVWLYRSGFPKSLDISKAMDRAAGAERVPSGEATATDDAKRWDGWGTALKPAIEPWVLARKPLSEPSVAANVQRWGTGALNIDACRAAMDGEDTRRNAGGGDNGLLGSDTFRIRERHADDQEERDGRWPANVLTLEDDEDLRFFRAAVGPVADYTKASSAEKPWDATPGGSTYTRICEECGKANFGAPDARCTCDTPRWKAHGTAGRKMVCQDCGRGDYYWSKDGCQECGSANVADLRGDPDELHPTVKPLDLMRHLVRLVTPPGGTVLDPFGGTGTTGEAAVIEGFDAVLIEREDAYLPLIQRRLDRTMGDAAPQVDGDPEPEED